MIKNIFGGVIAFIIAAGAAFIAFAIRAGRLPYSEHENDKAKTDDQLSDELRREVDIINSIPSINDRRRAALLRARDALRNSRRARLRRGNRRNRADQ